MWWSYYLTGPDRETGEVVLKWPQSGHVARLRLAEAKEPRFVEWRVIEHRPLKELEGTAIRFSLEEEGSAGTKVVFHQIGLGPECECYEMCSGAWEYLVGQIKKLVERGHT